MASVRAFGDGLTLAFLLDRTFEAVAASLREDEDELHVEFTGSNDEAAVAKQLARILGLEGDAEAWMTAGERDPTVGRLQREFPGFFTAAKPSPYDAAVWAIIAPRTNMRQAARMKLAMARDLGESVALGSAPYPVFPGPDRLVSLDSFPGLSDEKVARLRGIAEAALAGKLDVDRLRAMGQTDALRELQTLRGVGPWAASHIYFRGAAPADALPTAEPRVLRGYGDVYGVAAPDEACFRRSAERWRPHRMWVCVLLSRHLAKTAQWHAPSLRRERATAGRALARATASRGTV